MERRLHTDLIIVLDVGKTISKLTLWTKTGALLCRCTRDNTRIFRGAMAVLDVHGIEAWLRETLRDFAAYGQVTAIVPVAHGASLALIRDGALLTEPLDYEASLSSGEFDSYQLERGPFDETGSPRLPAGLNLGAQIYWLEHNCPELFDDRLTIIPYAQYWAWLLSGIAASEVTSFGCHSDLWNPTANMLSKIAYRREWADRLAPIRRADAILGPISQSWAEQTGLGRDVQIYCGIHDSNAALLAARSNEEIAGRDLTVLSTGTWFIAMRTPEIGANFNRCDFSEARDCLLNVDIDGKPVPSARFMGGREIELLIGLGRGQLDVASEQPLLFAVLNTVIANEVMVLPTMIPGSGPFPNGQSHWMTPPANNHERKAAISLFAAMMVDAMLGLVDARHMLLIEGRFASAELFVRALATLRPDLHIYISPGYDSVSRGALRLVCKTLCPAEPIIEVRPLDASLDAYHASWKHYARRSEEAA
jgi:sugar (pentulose or hexulose) kinase